MLNNNIKIEIKNKAKILALSTCITFLSLSLNAKEVESNIISNNNDKKLSLSLESGYRKDNLDWKISGFDSHWINSDETLYYALPTSSELSWSNIEIFETKIGAEIPIAKIKGGNLYLEGSIASGSTFDGENQDSDYVYEDIEFNRSNNNASSGGTEDYSLSLNYEIPLKKSIADSELILNSVTPSFGYSINKQNLRMTGGYQSLNIVGFDDGTEMFYLDPEVTESYIGAFSGLNSSYNSSWEGITLGLAIDTSLFEKHSLKLAGKYHLNNYYAEADWNLRSEFAHPKSFEHDADSKGIDLSVKYAYEVSQRLLLSLGLNYKKFTTSAGTDTTFFSDGSQANVKLDEVNWDSKSLLVGLNYKF
jgi:hypothetical protein